ncbi:20826_t:CDS:2 [Rhizophagus irregularis]|nr:20826_t:CDS:2 [Rhizophagus irregularis]
MRSNDLSCLSYRGFLESNRDTIITSITSTNTCNGLDNIWIHHFLKEAELLLDQKLFIALKNKNSKKRKQTKDKENIRPSKKSRSYITLFCWVRGDVPAAVHAITINIRKENTIGELKDLIKEKIEVPTIAKDIKLWKIEIQDNRDDELANFPLQDSDMLLATRKIGEYWGKMPPKRYIHVIIDFKKCNTNSLLRHGINSLLNDHNIDELCLYIESKLKEWIKRGNLYEDRELVTKVLFHALLSDIPNYYVDTEVPIDICHNVSLYADLLIVELKSADNTKRNRFIFEFKNKSVNFLDLRISGNNCNWEVMEQRAQKVETMSISDVRRLKCGNAERFDKGKTIEDIFSDARKQLLNYIHNLKDNSFHTSAFIVMSVGSRRLIWEKVN